MSDETKILGRDIAELEEALIGALIKQAGNGNAQAAQRAQAAISELKVQRAAAVHRKRLVELDGKRDLLVYLGELGQRESDAEAYVGHRLTDDEKSALEEGALRRRLEVAAVGLERVRAGAKPDRWMETR